MELTAPVRPDPGTPTLRLPCLVVVRGQDQGRVIPVDRRELVLGRGTEAQIRLLDNGISRAHAKLRTKGGRVWLEDLGSTNGIWCNGRRILQAALRDGDCLQFGACLVAFRINHPDEDRLLRQLYQRATRDSLTGLFNRASLEDRLAREVERHQRYLHGLAVLQLDLDHFKQINDTHGHAAGDQVLASVAKAVQGCLRNCDLAARAGGEEFVVVLPETDRGLAVAIAGKIRKRVAALELTHQGKSIRVTASLGVAAADASPVSAAMLLAAADAACYRAKKAGRNQVA